MKTNLFPVLFVSVCAILSVGPAYGFQKSDRESLPNFDKRSPEAAPAEPHRAAAVRLRERLPAVRVEFDRITGSPRRVTAERGFLTGPAQPADPNEPHREVKAFLRDQAELFGHGAEALEGARVIRDSVTPHNGLRTVTWQQELEGVPIFEAVLIANTTRRNELVNISSQFVADPAQARRGAEPKPKVTAPQAIARAAETLDEKAEPIAEANQRFTAPAFNGEIEAQLVWLPMSPGVIRLCWDIVLASRQRGETYRVLVDAETGEAHLRRCLTVYLSTATYRVFTSDSPSPFSPGHATPSTNQPPLVERSLVTLSAINTNASPLGWIDDAVNETRGNNVDAHLDRDANNSPDLPRPQGSPFRVFDFPMDLGRAPSAYTNASVVQLFYWCNWMHDRLYELGFTEAAGNFQANNFNRGGAGNDPLLADAQDGAGFNNANYTPTRDGTSPRIQMFIFNGPNPDRDGSLDAEIILHEYTHGLSDRLVGGGVGISALQTGGMGEGWSDFYGLALLSESGDDLEGNYAAGGYLTYSFFGLVENYYFGIRRYPYSTDMSANPLTLKDIDPTQASAHAGVPLSPLNSPFNPLNAPEVHNQGEVWCVTLWDVRANLIRKYGFGHGNKLTLQLVTDGMKLSPVNPNFLEARDAIIQADVVNTGGENLPELWAAFAKRGMGFNAIAPPSSTTTGVREAFDLPDDLIVSGKLGFTALGEEGGPFTPNAITFTLTNAGGAPLPWSAVNTSIWLTVTPASGVLPVAGPAVSVVAALNSGANLLPPDSFSTTVIFSNHLNGAAQPREFVLQVGRSDFFAELFPTNDFDLAMQSFTFTPDGSRNRYTVCREPAPTLPTNPAGGTNAPLSDDSFVQVTLADGATVEIYGERSDQFFIGSNGYLTMGSGDADLSASLQSHFSRVRAAALMRDLDPAAGGSVSWRQLSNRVAVTWLGVRQFGSTTVSNTFQIELFFEGTIRMSYQQMGSRTGVVGLSDGQGVPPGFVESDFSAYGSCGRFLTLSVPASVSEGAGLLTGGGTISLNATVPTNAVIRLTSSNTNELTVPAIVVLRAGTLATNFNIQIRDDAVLDGTQIAAISAAAPSLRPARALVAVHDNESAGVSVSAPATATEGDAPLTGTVTLSTPAESTLRVDLVSSDTNEIQVPPGVLLSAGALQAQFQINVVDDRNFDGPRSATISAAVANWIGGDASVVVNDNEVPTLQITLRERVVENQGTLSDGGTVSIPGILDSNLVVVLNQSDISELIVPAMVTIPAGVMETTFPMTAVNDSDIDGNQTVSVIASAHGWLSAADTTIVIDDETPPAPLRPTPPHLSTQQPIEVDLAWHSGEGELLVNGGFETGTFEGWVREGPGLGGYEINNGTLDPASPDGPFPPFEGNYSAVLNQSGPGQRLLYQEVALPDSGAGWTLRWSHRVRNFADDFAFNQHFRVEVRGTNNQVLAVAFTTAPGEERLRDWETHSYDLSAFAGQTIRIVFAQQDALFFLNIHIDAVSVQAPVTGINIHDIYFGKTPTPGYLASTTGTEWVLPDLELLTTYYWRIVSRRGAAQTEGPLWQFTTRGAEQLVWSAIPSPQRLGQAFPVTLNALDRFGVPVTNFSGAVEFQALSGDPEATLYHDDFEDGSISDWSTQGGAYTRHVTSDTAARGARSLTQIGGSLAHLDGLTQFFPEMQPQRVEFYLRASAEDLAGGYFVLGTGSIPESAVFFLMDRDGTMGLVDNAGARHATSFAANRWYKITFNFDWTSRLVDFFVDDQLVGFAVPFRGPTVDAASVLHLYNFDNTQVWYDEIRFTDGEGSRLIAMAPSVSGAFSNGAWSGDIAIFEPGAQITLKASGEGATGASGTFAVEAANDVSLSATAEPSPVSAGEPLTYTLVISNSGPGSASGMTLLDQLPAGVNLLSASASQGSCSLFGTFVMCNPGTIASQGQVLVTLAVTAANPDVVLTNVAAIFRPEGDAFPGNNLVVQTTIVTGPALSVAPVTVQEGNAGTTSAQFAVRLTGGSTNPVLVSYTTTNGTATTGLDFESVSGVLSFPPGVSTQIVSVPIIGDINSEVDETFLLDLSDPQNALLRTRRATGTILDNDAQTFATLPFVEDWESGQRPFWVMSGTGPYAGRITTFLGAHQGLYHLILDSSSGAARNEMTLGVNLANHTNVVLRFWAREYNDAPHGPPPTPFTGGADFDGVAVSMDGTTWYEVAGLRTLTDSYSEVVVDLDAALASHGLTYNETFRIRFNQYGSSPAPINGIAIDQISITGTRFGIQPAAAFLVQETCAPANGAIDPGEMVTVAFVLSSLGPVPATLDLVGVLLETGGVQPAGPPRDYGPIAPGGPPVTNLFTFRATGICGGLLRPAMQLIDGTNDLGILTFAPMTLGSSVVGGGTFSRPLLITIPDSGPATPYPSSNVVSGVTGLVTKVTVSLNALNHGFPADVEVLLVGPTGQRTILMADAGGSTAVTNAMLTFDDGGPPLSTSMLISGAYRPTAYGTVSFPAPAPAAPYATNLAVFNGTNPNGVWRLFVVDDSGGDTGNIASGWTLTITTSNPRCCSSGPSADLAVRMTDSPDPTRIGNVVDYTTTVSNLGPVLAQSVVLTNPLPAHVEFFSAASSRGSCTNLGTQVVCDIGNLASNQTATITLRLRSLTIDAITNTAFARSATLDFNLENNFAAATTRITHPTLQLFETPATEGTTNTVNLTFQMRLAAPSPLPVTVEFSTVEGTARAGLDYIPTNGVLEFPPGFVIRAVNVTVLPDAFDEPPETVVFRLSNPLNAILSVSEIQGTINDDDPSPTVRISDLSVPEGANGFSDALLAVQLSTNSILPVSINYLTAPGSALAGADFLATNGTVLFAPGETLKHIAIKIRGDLTNELDEVFLVNLLSPTNVTVADPQGRCTILNDDLLPTIVMTSLTLVNEDCAPGNQSLDPGERVTLRLVLRNVGNGTANASNLVATLLPVDGVVAPSPSQTYAPLVVGGLERTGLFNFRANRSCGDTITTSFRLEDSGVEIGFLSQTFQVGRAVLVLTQNFDSVTTALPPNWTAEVSGAGVKWNVTNLIRDSQPNSAFAPNPGTQTQNRLNSPFFSFNTTGAVLSFRHTFSTEAAFDGGSLLMAVGQGPFQDIIAAGGHFLSNGYTGTVAGEGAWTGSSGGLITTRVEMPASAVGLPLRLQWRMSTDDSISAVGWYVDTIALQDGFACCGPGVPSPVIEFISIFNQNVTLTWSALAGRRYVVQYKHALDEPEWLTVPGEITAASDYASAIDPLQPTQRFYRVLLVP